MELRRPWDLDPQGWIAAAILGQLALAERRFTDAREWYGKALTLQPINVEIWRMLGVIAWQQGLLNEAIADFEKSVSLDPLQTDAMEYLSPVSGGEWLERSCDARSERVQAFLADAETVASDSPRQGQRSAVPLPRGVGGEGRSPAENDSADCSDTTAAPHEYFGYTGCRSSRLGICSDCSKYAEAVLLTFNRGTPRSLDNDWTGPDHVFRYPQVLGADRSRVRPQQAENSDQKTTGDPDPIYVRMANSR